MGRKKEIKGKEADIRLDEDESGELQMILDRLSVQNPEGETLESYLGSLQAALNGRENLVAALLDHLSRDPSKVGFRVFLALWKSVTEKQVRRVVKQAAYRFSQKGYAVEESGTPVEKVVLIPKEVRKTTGHLILAEGTFWLVSALLPGAGHGGPVVVTAFAEKGFQSLFARVSETSNRAYREYIQQIGDHEEMQVCEVPVSHVARLFFEMAGFCAEGGTSPEIEQVKTLLAPFHDPAKPPRVYELMSEPENPRELIHGVKTRDLLEKIDQTYLLFSEKDLQPYRQKIQELESPVLVVPPEVQRSRVMDELRRAADELCVDRKKYIYQRYFEEAALVWKSIGWDQLATSAWIVARHIACIAKSGESPLIFQMVILSMQVYWPDDFKGQGQGQGQEGDPTRRTESGLILP